MEGNIGSSHLVHPLASEGIDVLGHMGVDIHDPPDLSIDRLVDVDHLVTDQSVAMGHIPFLLEVLFSDGA